MTFETKVENEKVQEEQEEDLLLKSKKTTLLVHDYGVFYLI